MAANPISSTELKLVTEEILGTIHEFRKKNDLELEEIRKHHEANGLLREEVITLNNVITELRQRQDEIEKRAQRPIISTEQESYAELEAGFEEFLRGRKSYNEYRSHLSQASKGLPENVRGLTEMVDTQGGLFVAPTMAKNIINKAHQLAGIRPISSVMTIGSDQLNQPIMGLASVVWGTENFQSNDQNIPVSNQSIFVKEARALSKVSTRLLQDTQFDLQAALSAEFGRAFADDEDNWLAVGQDPNKPVGIFTNAAIQSQYVATGISNLFNNSSNNGVDALISLYYTPKRKYRINGTFLMNSGTEGVIRKLKDNYGRYLWEPSVTLGAPPTIVGRPVAISEYAPAIAANAFPVIFGDFTYYQIVDRVGLTIQVLTELYSTTGQVGYIATRRVGADCVLSEAFASIKVATS